MMGCDLGCFVSVWLIFVGLYSLRHDNSTPANRREMDNSREGWI